MRDEHSVVMADGQAEMKGKIIRFAHMGDTARREAADAGFEALSQALSQLGHSAPAVN